MSYKAETAPDVLHMRVVQPDAGVKDAHLDARALEARLPQLLCMERPLQTN